MIKKTQTKKEPSYSDRVLWTLYHYETLKTKEVVDIFRLTESHASNVLRGCGKKGGFPVRLSIRNPMDDVLYIV